MTTPSLTVYTQPQCQPCRLLQRHLDRAGIQYVNEPATDHIDQLRNAGVTAAPAVQWPSGRITVGAELLTLPPRQVAELLALDAAEDDEADDN